VGGLEAQDMIKERGGAGALVRGPREQLVELVSAVACGSCLSH
jgi:hypothetical protein